MKGYYQAVKLKLECGHEILKPTSYYRLRRTKISVIISECNWSGVWCPECKVKAQPIKYLGTCRL